MKTLRLHPVLTPWVVSSILATSFWGCATSPTGRKQLTVLPDSMINNLGVQSFSQMKSQAPTDADPATRSYVMCITQPLTATAQRLYPDKVPKEWEVVVFKNEEPNAFALPGGKIGVHTGLMNVAKTPGQLAAVIGHEIGHVVARHGNERISQGLLAQGGLIAADLALFAGKEDSPKNRMVRQLVIGGLGLGAQLGALLPFSRSHESESDIIGLKIMAQSGFPPEESVELWKNMMSAAGGKGPPEFLSTHPSGDTRIRQLQEKLPEAQQQYAAAGNKPQCRR
jgi:predicted Zn-dependent protease